MAEKAGMSTGTKIAMGVAGAVGAAVIGAATFGGGYVIYKNVKGKQQDASPLQLHILVKNAKNLKDEDTFGESDPYVVVEVDDVKKRTKTVENNHSPTWNEELTIGVFEEHMDTNIVFGVWDDDHGSDEELGDVFVPLSGVTHSKKDFDLGMKHGSLHVTMWLSGQADK